MLLSRPKKTCRQIVATPLTAPLILLLAMAGRNVVRSCEFLSACHHEADPGWLFMARVCVWADLTPLLLLLLCLNCCCCCSTVCPAGSSTLQKASTAPEDCKTASCVVRTASHVHASCCFSERVVNCVPIDDSPQPPAALLDALG